MVPTSTELRDERFVAKRLRVKVKTLQAWRTRGGGPEFIKVGRLVRYSDHSVERFLAANSFNSTSESIDK